MAPELVVPVPRSKRLLQKKQAVEAKAAALEDDEWFFEEVLDRKPGKKGQYQYKVHWTGYGSDQDSWITRDLAGDDNALAMLQAFDSKCEAKLANLAKVDAVVWHLR